MLLVFLIHGVDRAKYRLLIAHVLNYDHIVTNAIRVKAYGDSNLCSRLILQQTTSCLAESLFDIF